MENEPWKNMIEHSRYEFNRPLFFAGMLCLLIFMCLLSLSLYCLPYLIWGLHYSVPAFIADWKFQWMDIYDLSESVAGLLIFFILFLPSLMSGLIANYISNHIDRSLLAENVTEAPLSAPERSNKTGTFFNSLMLMSKILVIMIIALTILFSIEWLISL